MTFYIGLQCSKVRDFFVLANNAKIKPSHIKVNPQYPLISINTPEGGLLIKAQDKKTSENSEEFPAESGYKANDLTRYKVDTARHVLAYI